MVGNRKRELGLWALLGAVVPPCHPHFPPQDMRASYREAAARVLAPTSKAANDEEGVRQRLPADMIADGDAVRLPFRWVLLPLLSVQGTV